MSNHRGDNRRFNRLAIGLLLLGPVGTFHGEAQERGASTFRVETTLIQVEVQVLGRGGEPVRDLTREDFVLKENGKAQQIATFEFAGGEGRAGDRANPGPPAVQQPSQQHEQIYLLTEATYGNYLPVYEAIRVFLRQSRQPGTLVSLAGMPFTEDPDQLLRTLELMRQHPNGRGSPGDPDWVPAFVPRCALEYERLQSLPFYSARRQNIERSSGRARAGGFNERAFQERLMFLGYIDLIRQLGVYPGKKTVILFSAGLDLSQENLDDLNHLASEALRNRVTFYTVYSRGLQLGVRNGLHALATHTGGKALVDSNDLSPIFGWVAEDSRNYYLLGYYPQNMAEAGRFRRIQVAVSRPGVKVRTEPGFYEPLPFTEWSQRQKEMHLYRAVLTQQPPSDFAVNADCKISRGADGEPLVLLTAAVPLHAFSAKRRGGKDLIRFSIVTRAIDRNGGSGDLYDSWMVTKVYKSEALDEARRDAAILVGDTENLKLPPGSYEVAVAVRDDHTGKTGTARTVVTVPDIHPPQAPAGRE